MVLRLTGEGIATVPGCLTGESEERETWTAESLRAASLIEGACLRVGAAGRDFGGRRFRSTPLSLCGRAFARCQSHAGSIRVEKEWDLVKRCDRPGKVLIQLESLILAQSERWRQA